MPSTEVIFRLHLRGSMRLFDRAGARIEIPSRKGQALLAMLAAAPDGERRRNWLQDRLWGTRQLEQARSSLRTELRHLREILDRAGGGLEATREIVRLDLRKFWVDVLAQPAVPGPEVLEGLDIPGEEGFEDWLREFRQSAGRAAAAALRAPALPAGLAQDWRPTLCVTASGEAADEDFLDDLVDRLSRLRWVRVTRGAPAIEAAYGLEVKWRASALEPHATLVVTDQASGEVLWTGRSRVEAPARAAELRADVAQIDATLDQAEQRRAMNSAADDQDLRTLIAQGRWRLNRLNRRDGDEAKALFDRILAESPENPEGLVQKALAIGWSAWAGREDSEGMRELRALARKAMLADNLDGRGFMLAGIANIWLRNSSAAKVLLRQAVELNPSLVMAWGQLGTCHVMAGEPEEGAEALRLAVDMNPADMHVFYPLGELAMALAMLGRWEEAITWADRSLVRRPRYWYAQLVRIAAFDAVDRPRDAAGAYRELLFETPRFSSDFIDWTPFEHEDWPGELKRRLTRVGGLPDPAPRG